jgi:hypothetical protein
MYTLEEIQKAEREIIQAMLKSDVAELDRLISDQLIFSAHTGKIFGKQADLDAHRSGNIKVESVEPEDYHIRMHGETALVFVLLRIKGYFFGNYSEGIFRFSRVWMKEEGEWKVVAGQSTMIS